MLAIGLLAAIGALATPWLVHDGFVVATAITWVTVLVLATIGLRRIPQAASPIDAIAPPPPAEIPAAMLHELESLRAMQGELLAAKQTAEAATMAKGEFLATMSHEIRTPLNGIVPLLDLLRSTPLQPDQREYLATAHQSALELLRIVDDILDYSKLEASKLELESVGVNLKELVDSVTMLMEGSANAKGLRLGATIDPSVRLAVRGDPVRLRQVLTNLVSNAIKFTERGNVTIQIGKRGESRSHHELMFAVRDTGIGLTPATAAKLFQPFSQADTSTTRLYGGSGLGLVICKRLVDLMGGKIGVRSEPGRGSMFWFSLPLQKAIGDIRTRRDLSDVRALLLSGDDAFVRRAGGFLAHFGMNHLHSDIAADALSKLRASASVGERWGYELLLIDLESMRTATVALVRNIVRDPALDSLRILIAGGDDGMQDLRDASRIAALPSAFDERELRGALNELLGIGDVVIERDNPLFAANPVPMDDPASAPRTRQLGGRVLLVEDNAVNAQVARRLLSMLGVEVDDAANGQIALDHLSHKRYDLILMDCQMPVMDGYTATREQRAQEARNGSPRLAIIAMTANAMVGDREKCLAAGMDDYLTKPLDRRLLEKTLAHWLFAATDAHRSASATSAAPHAGPSRAEPITPVETLMPAHAPAIDQNVIHDLLDVMGDEFASLVHVYLEDTPLLVARLREASGRADFDTIVDAAHVLKSSSANLGALPLAELAKSAEHDALARRPGELRSHAQRIEMEFRRVRDALEALGLTRA
jgi:signal transduction histidine kinase/CheY-like chemotaxis protein/HPt (histidine-containing phosphotransfer) domain-containing protein